MSLGAGAARHDVACVAHVHTRHSDGTATVAEVAASAGRAGARVVLVTDHDTLGARHAGQDGWHGDVLVVAGHEISPRGGHFLAFDLEEEIPHRGRTEAEIARAVAAAGGFGFAAHPFSAGSRISTRIGRPHGWPALEDPACTGIELWSLITDAAERCTTLAQLLRLVRDPRSALEASPPPEALRVWDRLGRERRVPAIGGLDAHQTGLRVGGRVISPFPNDRVFGLLQTHLLLDEALPPAPEQARAAVLGALREGSAYLAAEALWPGRGFAFWATDGDGAGVPMGAETPARALTLRVRLPREAEVALLGDGKILARRHTGALEHRADRPGVYRVEARLRGRAWILSNPIHLR